MTSNKHILFVHIPKTAGTSFRIAAEEYFGKQNTFYDYSSKSDETSKEIIDTIYSAKDPYQFYEHIAKLDSSFLSGHYPVGKYAVLYNTLNVVSFVRDPVAQVLSHYNHYKNLHSYKKDLIDFIKEPRFGNTQSKLLHQKHLTFYGFIGVTEEYNDSIDLFNDMFATDLPRMHINKKDQNSLMMENIDQKTVDLIKHLNNEDMKLYYTVCKQFAVRKNLAAKNLPFTYGFIQKNIEKQISGIAFQRESDDPIEIDIYKDNKYLETVLAKNLRPGQKDVPRKGFIGFDYLYKGDGTLDGKLHAYVKHTGQEII